MSIEEQQLWKMVMARYPKLENERTCAIEKRMRDMARQSMFERLKNERAGQDSILDRSGADAAQG